MTLLNPKHIDLRELFSVRHILDSHGFEVQFVEDKRETLLPSLKWTQPETELLFRIFGDENSRKELFYKITDPYFNLSKTDVKSLTEEIGFLSEIKRYLTTFEWYIGELMIKHFGAFSASYGVNLKNIKSSENTYYDILIVLRSVNLMYFKCKVEEFSNDEVIKCIKEGLDLYSEQTVMFIDDSVKEARIATALRGINHPFNEKAELKKIWTSESPEDVIYEWGNFYMISDSGNIKEKIRIIMRINAAKKVNMLDFSLDSYPKIG